jgi:hypothetical protein
MAECKYDCCLLSFFKNLHQEVLTIFLYKETDYNFQCIKLKSTPCPSNDKVKTHLEQKLETTYMCWC